MRGTVAKRIRRMIFKDKAFKNQYQYMKAASKGKERLVEKPRRFWKISPEEIAKGMKEFYKIKAHKLINPQRLPYREAKRAYRDSRN